MAGAAGSAAAYWASHHDRSEQAVDRTFVVELAPSQPGSYEVYVPVPATKEAKPMPGLALRVEQGAPRFALVQTEHGAALSVRADGPVKLRAEGAPPVRLTLDDGSFSFRQFKFWSYLARDAPGPVLVKVEVRQFVHAADWDQHADAGKAILVQEPLEPVGWQVVRATQLFDVSYGSGWGAEFPRMALGAGAVSLGALYLPLGLVVLQARRARPSHDAFK